MSFSSASDICARRFRSRDRDAQVARTSVTDSSHSPNMRHGFHIGEEGHTALECERCIDIVFTAVKLLLIEIRRASISANENLFIAHERESSIVGAKPDTGHCSLGFRCSAWAPGACRPDFGRR